MPSSGIKNQQRYALIIFLMILVLGAGSIFNDLNNHKNSPEEQNERLLEELATYLQYEVDQRVNLLDLFAQDWLEVDNTSKLYSEDRFYQKAQYYGNFHSGVEAVKWINTSGVITYAYSRSADPDPTIGQNITLFSNGSPNTAFVKARNSRNTTITPLVQLYIGYDGYVIYYPLVYENELIGFFNLVLIAGNFLDEMIQNLPVLENHDLSITDSDDLVYSTSDIPDNHNWMQESLMRQDSIFFLDRVWQLTLTPGAELVNNTFIQSIGIILAILAAIVIITLSMYLFLQQAKKSLELMREKQEMQEILRQTEKTEAIGRLAGGIAHDFNNLLTIINGYAALALGVAKQESLPDLENFIEKISETSSSAGELINQLLTFTRKYEINYQVIEINKVLSRTMPLIERLLDQRITIEYSPTSDQCFVNGDPIQLQQILMNLVINAMDAIENEGKIYIEFSCPKDAEQMGNGEYCVLSVKDNGKGMDEDTLMRIFDPFYTTKEVGKGTGLGLSIVDNIVREMNGKIRVESKPQMGSTFFIYLPLVQ